MRGLRSSEWLLMVYFVYVALIAPWFPLDPRVELLPLAVLLLVCALFVVLAYAETHGNYEIFSVMRDWVPLGLALIAYREMDWFSRLPRDFHLEMQWMDWDRALLYRAGLQHAIESLGVVLPTYLELCYVLVYAVGPAALAILYIQHCRKRADQVVFIYLLGTLLAYSLFPYFPSDPPRVVFGGSDMPHFVTAIRRFNLWLLGGYGIHSSVFPSAHVSSAFSAAWALLAYLRERKVFGFSMLVYAISVAIATVYGRYHYAADVVAGFAVSLVPALTILLARRPLRLHLRGLPSLP